VAPSLWGEPGLEPFSETLAANYSRDNILNVLTELCGGEVEANAILDAASGTFDANDLRRRLGVGLADFNESLARYFPAVPLVDNGPDHAEEFDLRRRQRQRELVDWARQVRIDRFDAGQTQAD